MGSVGAVRAELARQVFSPEVESLDLEPIKFKIGSNEDGYGWTDEHADRIELAYRRFLMLLPVRTGLLLVLKTRTE